MSKRKRIYIIAEAGVNHNGSIDVARHLIDAAAAAGADAVKFQTFKAETLVTGPAPKAEYQKVTTDIAESQFEMLEKLEIDAGIHRDLADHSRMRDIQFLSTPFDIESLNLLTKIINVPILKISSGDITNGPLLMRAAQAKKPIILSTGMSTLSEIRTALGILAFGYTRRDELPSLAAFRDAYRSRTGQRALKANVTLLHCTTEYPAPFSEVNLRAMYGMRAAFGLPVGLSDHTRGISVSIAAAALGASVIEKHLTLDRNQEGPDHKASIEPNDLRLLVRSIREVEDALGSVKKGPTLSELKNLTVVRKSLVALQDILQGDMFTIDNMGSRRPGTGISPLRYWQLLRKKAGKNYHRDEMIKA
jgi:N-acetylneuraminate synthase